MNNDILSQFGKIRELFPVASGERNITYFNNSATGPLNINSRKKMDWYHDECFYHNRDTDHAAFDDLEYIRKTGAKFIGAGEDEVGFGFNTGYGLNIAAFGLPLEEGDEVLLSDVEFPSNVYPWLGLKPRGVKVKFLPALNRFFDIETFKKAITDKTRVLSLSFVQFFNGYKNDLKTIGKICGDRELYFVVDAIQGCGAETINVKDAGIDILSSGAQKWLLSPLGTGIFYVRRELRPKLKRPFAGWLGVDWGLNFSNLFHYDKPPFDSARKYELGTYPYGHIFGMAEAFKIIERLGVENIQKHNHQLIDILIDFLQSEKRFTITSDLTEKHRSSILTFTCENAGGLHRELLDNGFICALREGSIRLAVHLYNDRSDIDKLITFLGR